MVLAWLAGDRVLGALAEQDGAVRSLAQVHLRTGTAGQVDDLVGEGG